MRSEITSFLWVAGPKIIAGGLQFGLTLLLLRYFAPAQFGLLSVCMAIVLVSDSVLGGATDSGVLRLAPLHNERSALRSVQFQQAGLVLKLILATLLAVPVLLLARPISSLLFQTPDHAVYLAVTFAALVGTLSLRSVQMHFQVNHRFVPYGVSDLLSTTLKFGGILLLLLLASPGPMLILCLYAAAPLLVASAVLGCSGRKLITVPFSLSSLSEISSYVKWYLATAAMGTLVSRMDLFLVSAIAGVGAAGIFSAGQVIALLPQLIGSYIAVVFSPRIMPMWEAGTLLGLYKKFQAGIAAVAVLALLIAVVAVPKLGPLVFPPRFLAAGSVILLLLPAGLCSLVNYPLTMLLLLFSRPRFLFLLDCVFLPLMLIADLRVIPVYGATGAAIVTSTGVLLKTAVMQYTALRLLRGSPQETSYTPEVSMIDEVSHAN